MIDKEKVLKGLLACLEGSDCEHCSYSYPKCATAILSDAYMLIQEQDAIINRLYDFVKEIGKEYRRKTE